MLHITCHYYNFVIIYTACLAHLNAHYIHLNTFSTRKSVTNMEHNTYSQYDRFEC